MSDTTQIRNRVHGLAAALVTIAFPFLLTVIAFYCELTWSHWATVRFVAWLGCILFFLWFLLVIGNSVKQRLLGVLLNERNRYSLSRLQMLLWSLLILPSLYVILLNNVYFKSPGEAAFTFNWQLLVLMGMSVTSVVSTPLILSRKSDTISAPTAGEAAAGAGASAGALDANLNPQEANLTELIMGEEVSNLKTIDIGRIQMLMMSMIVVVIYGCMIGGRRLAHSGLSRPGHHAAGPGRGQQCGLSGRQGHALGEQPEPDGGSAGARAAAFAEGDGPGPPRRAGGEGCGAGQRAREGDFQSPAARPGSRGGGGQLAFAGWH